MKADKIKEAISLLSEIEALNIEIDNLQRLGEHIVNEDDFYKATNFNVSLEKSEKRVDGMNYVGSLADQMAKTIDSYKIKSIGNRVDFNGQDTSHWIDKLNPQEDKINDIKFIINNNEFLLVLGTIIQIRKNRLNAVEASLKSMNVDLR